MNVGKRTAKTAFQSIPFIILLGGNVCGKCIPDRRNDAVNRAVGKSEMLFEILCIFLLQMREHKLFQNCAASEGVFTGEYIQPARETGLFSPHNALRNCRGNLGQGGETRARAQNVTGCACINQRRT